MIYQRVSNELSISEIPECAKEQTERIENNEKMIRDLLSDRKKLEEKVDEPGREMKEPKIIGWFHICGRLSRPTTQKR